MDTEMGKIANLLENEEEDVANKKIAVLRGEKTLSKKDFLELFK